VPTVSVPVDDLVRDTRVRVEAEACPVLVALVEGRAYAVQDACRHRQASLLTGVLRDGVVTCPSHFWQYDLRTGARHDTDGEGLPSYPARLVREDGTEAASLGDAVRVEVEVPDAAPAPTLREVLLAHARGNTP